ncbi:MAG: amidase [Gammaproteobacteria bacterium]|nr:amidase [Gammaproteobacteria bacterium]
MFKQSLYIFILAFLLACGNKAPEPVVDALPEIPAYQNPLILNASVLELQAMVEAGELTYAELTRFYLDRINAYNPALKAVIAVNPDALKYAGQRDAERASVAQRGPLYGMPILLKDNIEAGDVLATTAGSLLLKDNVTWRDATLVARLRQQGAIILGKANLSEWANFRSERSSSGWSSVGGQTRNPYDLQRSPCGSSSGSAVAVAAKLAPLAIGTETDGSIVCPASVNGVVGIKPTVGLVSRAGIVPLSPSQDTAGPMAASVADAAILLSGMIEKQAVAIDTFALERPDTINFDYPSAIGSVRSADKIRVATIANSGGWHSDVDALFSKTMDKLGKAGMHVNPDQLQLEDDAFAKEYDLLLYEFKFSLNHYLGSLPTRHASLTLEKLIELNQAQAGQVMPYFGQEIFIKAQAKGGLDEDEYKNIRKELSEKVLSNGLEAFFHEHPEVQALIVPSGGPAWSIDLVNGDHFLGNSSSYAAVSGYPSITLPMGEVHGLPIGLSLIARPYQEFDMLAIADKIEKILAVNLEPTAFQSKVNPDN